MTYALHIKYILFTNILHTDYCNFKVFTDHCDIQNMHNILNTYRLHVNYIQITYRLHTDYIQNMILVSYM
jgi:hypothetical protein